MFLIPSINTISYFEVKCIEKRKKKIVVGKVIVAKAIGIFILYIGRIRFVINRLGNTVHLSWYIQIIGRSIN